MFANTIIPGKRLLIRPPVEAGKTQAGIFLPEGVVSEFNPWQGEIVAVGVEAGDLYRAGMIVVIIPRQAIPLELDGEVYLMIQTDAVMAIVPELQRIVKMKVMESREKSGLNPNGGGRMVTPGN